MYISWCVSLAVVHALGNVCRPDGVQLFINFCHKSILFISQDAHIHWEKMCLRSQVTYSHINTRINSVNTFMHTNTHKELLHLCNIEHVSFTPICQCSPLSLNSFDMLNDGESLEDTATDVSGIHLSVKPVCSCVFPQVSKQRDSPVNISFQYAAFFPCAESQCWPLKHAGMHLRVKRQTNTYTPVQSAGVVVDSEGRVCRGFVPERPPCKHTCRQDLKPCCRPASPPLSPGTNPAHKQALR